MVATAERPLRMLVVHARCGGFHVALVPADLSHEQLEAALDELGIEGGKAVLELAVEDFGMCLAVAYVPALDEN